MKKNNLKKTGRIVLPFALVIAIIIGCSSNGGNVTYNPTNDTLTVTVQPDVTIETQGSEPLEEDNQQLEDFGIKTADSYDNMKLGEIGQNEGVYVGLSYVKEMSALPVAFGSNVEVSSPDNDVIIGFFDFFNPLNKRIYFNPADITCYADGIQVSDVESIIKPEADGVLRYYYAYLDPGTKIQSISDFEVPKNWEELKFFYNSECMWTIHKEDVSTENYEFDSLYKDVKVNFEETKEGDNIYSERYEIIFDGFELYDWKDYKDTKKMAVFKFTYNNTSDEAIKLDFLDCIGYQDGYVMSERHEYDMEDKIGDYINCSDVESIEKGMTAKMYIGFPVKDYQAMNFYLALDDGDEKPEAYVYIPDNTLEDQETDE